jgi:hypothetical protein
VVLEGGVINGTVRMGETAVQEARDLRDAPETPVRPGLALSQ